MKKALTLLLILTLVFSMIVGCSPKSTTPNNTASPAANQSAAVKTGLAVISSIGKSTSAGEKDGLAQIDSSIVALTVDSNGKIVKCIIDAIQTKANFSKEGKILTDLKTQYKSKNELGEAYGMKKASGIGKEWSEEAAVFANYVVGKTVDEVKGIAVNEEGAATGADLKSSVTISVGNFIAGIEKAVANAKDVGAKANDKLGLGTDTSISKSTDAGDKEGLVQAYSYYTATTFDADGKITSCVIDASQTNVNFDKTGKITSDLKAAQKTKFELGDAYGMKKASGIGKEWYQEADAFAKYAVGKTVAQLKGITVNEKGAATISELTSSVTVSVKEFISSIEKAGAVAK